MGGGWWGQAIRRGRVGRVRRVHRNRQIAQGVLRVLGEGD